MSHAGILEQPRTGISNGKLAMWLFLCSEVMFFTGLIGAYIVLRMSTPDWPTPSTVLNIPLTALNTFFLICSSVTMVNAFAAATEGHQAGIRKFLFATFLIGSLFLSIQMYEYRKLIHHGFVISGGIFPSCFYTMTGFHGAHVAGGVIAIFCLLIQAFRGKYGAGNYAAIEYVGLYWHFVDLVWIILFTIVYLI
ncbi:MAG: heme-copper oxidase subunit III [Candidatus Omnitrophica bacterium]|nr:heme-copper oxidase subunit III [Candidatus Omnitrophota bacterium]